MTARLMLAMTLKMGGIDFFHLILSNYCLNRDQNFRSVEKRWCYLTELVFIVTNVASAFYTMFVEILGVSEVVSYSILQARDCKG
jgi:hypothetical protein